MRPCKEHRPAIEYSLCTSGHRRRRLYIAATPVRWAIQQQTQRRPEGSASRVPPAARHFECLAAGSVRFRGERETGQRRAGKANATWQGTLPLELAALTVRSYKSFRKHVRSCDINTKTLRHSRLNLYLSSLYSSCIEASPKLQIYDCRLIITQVWVIDC